MVMQIPYVTPIIFLLMVTCFAAPQNYRTESSKINDQDSTTTQLSKIDLGGPLSYHRRSRETIQEQNDTREEAKEKIEESTEDRNKSTEVNKTKVSKEPAATIATETATAAAATTTVTTTEATTIGATTVAATTATTTAATATNTTTTTTTTMATEATETTTTTAAATTTAATTTAVPTAIVTQAKTLNIKDLPPGAIFMAGGTTMTMAYRGNSLPIHFLNTIFKTDFDHLGQIALFLSGNEYQLPVPKRKREMKREVMEAEEEFETYPTTKDAATALRVVQTLKGIKGAPATVAQMMFDTLHASTLPPPGRSFPLTDYVQEWLVLEERIRQTQASPERLRAAGMSVLREMEDAVEYPVAGTLNLHSLSIVRALRIELCFSQFWLDIVKHFASDASNNIPAEDVKVFHRVVHYIQPCTKSPPPRPPVFRKPSQRVKKNNPNSAKA